MQRLWAVVCALVLCVAGVVGVQQPAAATSDARFHSVTYGNGLFVAVGIGETASGNYPRTWVMTSENGTNWTAQSAPQAEWVSVTYGDGLFVAVAEFSGTNPVMTSRNGRDWNEHTAPEGDWVSVTYGGDLFVAVANGDGDGANRVMTSRNGVEWNELTAPVGSWSSVTYASGLFVAVGANRVMRSRNGVEWIALTAPAGSWVSVTYGNGPFGGGLFVAVAFGGTKPVMTSPDGVTWTAVRAAVAQKPKNSCVKRQKRNSIRRNGSTTMMKAGCETNARMPVGLKVKAKERTQAVSGRGDKRHYRLICVKKNGKTTGPVKAFGKFQKCNTGKKVIRTYGTPLRIKVTWKAKSTPGFPPFKQKQTYKT